MVSRFPRRHFCFAMWKRDSWLTQLAGNSTLIEYFLCVWKDVLSFYTSLEIIIFHFTNECLKGEDNLVATGRKALRWGQAGEGWPCVPGKGKGFRKGIRKTPKVTSSGAHRVGKVHMAMVEVQADGLRLGQLVLLMAGLWTFRISHGPCVLIWLLGGVFIAPHSLIYSSTDQSRGHKAWQIKTGFRCRSWALAAAPTFTCHVTLTRHVTILSCKIRQVPALHASQSALLPCMPPGGVVPWGSIGVAPVRTGQCKTGTTKRCNPACS